MSNHTNLNLDQNVVPFNGSNDPFGMNGLAEDLNQAADQTLEAFDSVATQVDTMSNVTFQVIDKVDDVMSQMEAKSQELRERMAARKAAKNKRQTEKKVNQLRTRVTAIRDRSFAMNVAVGRGLEYMIQV